MRLRLHLQVRRAFARPYDTILTAILGDITGLTEQRVNSLPPTVLRCPQAIRADSTDAQINLTPTMNRYRLGTGLASGERPRHARSIGCVLSDPRAISEVVLCPVSDIAVGFAWPHNTVTCMLP